MKKLNLFFLSFLALTFFACEDDEAVLDTDAPSITIAGPQNEAAFYPDDDIVLDATVTDDLGLQMVQIWVTPPDGTARKVFEEDIEDFLNDNTEVELDVPLTLSTDGMPEAGMYTVKVLAIDEQENQTSESIEIEVLEADETAPVATVVSPAMDEVYTLGGMLDINAEVTEEKALKEVVVMAMSDAEGGTVLFDETFTEFEDPTMFTLEESVEIPTDANVGAYTLVITPTDMAGNVGEAKEVAFRVEAAE